MMYSYRPPFKAVRATAHPKNFELPDLEATDLVERRRFVRSIPAPEAIESNDAAAWELWAQAVEALR